jgi:signal transduction histidine kinase/CheY-like chemotaxis protein
MRIWFERLPIHRKLVVVALAVTTVALVVALGGLGLIDLLRFRAAANADAAALGRVVAENLGAAVVFEDLAAANDTLESVREREQVRRACVYLPDGRLFAGFARAPGLACARTLTPVSGYDITSASVDVTRNDKTVGTVYIERDVPDIGTRIALSLLTGGGMLIIAAALGYALSHRLNQAISRPIVQLANAARAIGHKEEFVLPPIDASPDEVGELVGAFSDMVARMRRANAELLSSNDSLRREIEERRRVEAERELLLARERQASRLKDEFLAAVSHELRTPLNAIVGWIQILAAQKPDDQTLARAIGSLSRNAQAQTRVIEDLIDVSRAVTGKLHLNFEAVDLRVVIEAAVDVIAPVARAKKVELTFDLPAAPAPVNGDPDRLQQVIWNLLSNAVKFTPSGGSVMVSLHDAAGTWTLDVSDTGCGIAPEFLPRAFERFLQVDGSMTRQHGGLGLGLAIVKDLTELHGGTVSVSSDGIGRGATFSVRLPRLGGTAIVLPASPALPVPSLAGLQVLIVDDNEDALEVLEAALRHAGAEVWAVSSGEAALQRWRLHPPDILLCDLAMPGMNGFDVLQRIRDLPAGTGPQVPAIAISAYASAEDIRQTMRAGFGDHIAKPYHPDDVIRRVAALTRRGARDQSADTSPV